MTKVSELIREKEKDGKQWFSLEFYPYKTTDGVHNLFDRVDRLGALGPLFADITWGAGGSTANMSMEIAAAIQNYICIETQMHLTCTNMEKEKFEHALNQCKEKQICNILALRGDPPRGQERWTSVEGGFEHAVDLVKFIRKEHGDFFGIAVAGYPEGHQEAKSYEDDIMRLKEKVDAGADVVVTQLFYDKNVFIDFVADCREAGIACPIIPGIMPLTKVASLEKIVKMSGTKIPQDLWDGLEPIKDDEEAVKKFGAKYVAQMCRDILDSGVCSGIHIYTMNQEAGSKALLEELDLISQRGTFPWRAPVVGPRQKEDVRPIFWANRPKSYLVRTQDWNKFPSGRWGENRSPDYGSPGNWHNLPERDDLDQRYREMWGESVETEQAVFDVFCSFVEGKINLLPWNEVPMRSESSVISQDLLDMNRAGMLTINSQPRVNGADSKDEKFGWGQEGGRLYQKAYVEFFTSRDKLEKLIEVANSQHKSISIYAVNRKGDTISSESFAPRVNAVTWGIFPNSEVLQPTVVDPNSLLSWKDEAFGLWETMWASLYDKDSQSAKVLGEMIDSYYLVTCVDNDFIEGEIFAVFQQVIKSL